ncbi:MAG: DUF1761 domain-containing protein [Bacteroidales bacterium]|nr:DUF1761 domain-containing protein [Bacteroidales bacterium]
MGICLADLNYLAILFAALINQVWGFLWYSPIMFGKKWAEDIGIDLRETDKKQATRGILAGMVLSVFIYFTIAVIIELTHSSGWSNGAITGFVLALLIGFQTAVNYVYEGKSRRLFLINTLFYITAYTIGGAIIGFF